MATSPAQRFAAENRFFKRSAIVLIAIAALGFLVFNLAGITDIFSMPSATHVHAAVMSAWLVVFAMQVLLATSGNIALHRRLGWFGAGLALASVLTGFWTISATFGAGRVPGIFPPGYFLMLGYCNITLFAAFVAAAIAMRKRTDWHKRLMLGSLVMIYEPVLGRTLPFFIIPALGGPEAAFPAILANREAFELFRFAVHIAIALALLLFDRRASGRVHPATWLMVAGVVTIYVLANGIGLTNGFTDYALSLMPQSTALP
ncbi:MAG: hypothetical protein V2I27_12610 [Erythrobacter sp.]|jgi:hypothetical protein|nr:hypothetical protein [Erythrobacter sp.]